MKSVDLKHKIKIITVFFGRVPEYFDAFLSSCGWNDEFHFLLIHDTDIPYDIPENVQNIKLSFDEFIKLVNTKLKINIKTLRPYKICDLKPCFGTIFEDYLAEYDFWGCCDTDLVFGNLSKYITDKVLDRYDKLLTYGHLFLIRNNETCNRTYLINTKGSNNFQDVISVDQNCIFDEERGITEKFVETGKRVYIKRICGNGYMNNGRFTIVTGKMHKIIQSQCPYYTLDEKKNYRYQAFCVDKGKIYKVYFKNRFSKNVHKIEYAYLHKLELPGNIDASKRYVVTNNGYISDQEFFNKLDQDKLIYKDIARVVPANVFKEELYNMKIATLTILRRSKRRLIQWIANRQR